MQQLINIVQAIAAFNFLMGAVLLWTSGKQKVTVNRQFAFFLLGKGLMLISTVLFIFFNRVSLLVSLAYVLLPFLFFYAPFLYFYVAKLVGEPVSNRKKVLHLVPFGLLVCFFSCQTVFFHAGLQYDWVRSFKFYYFNYCINLYYVQTLGYTIYAFYLILKVKSLDALSNPVKGLLNWFSKVLALFLVVWCLFLLSDVMDANGWNSTVQQYSKLIGMLLLLVLSNTTLMMGFTKPMLIHELIEKSEEVKEEIKKQETSKVPKYINESTYQTLCTWMEEEKPYLNADLSLKDVAQHLGIVERNVSLLIKTYGNAKFNEFINEYRIKYAQEKLISAPIEATILEILYDSGFKSKSVFNTSFKKKVGVTPTHYRKEYHQEKLERIS